jgi:hypothetical protein
VQATTCRVNRQLSRTNRNHIIAIRYHMFDVVMRS